jgi:hypothetical protein
MCLVNLPVSLATASRFVLTRKNISSIPSGCPKEVERLPLDARKNVESSIGRMGKSGVLGVYKPFASTKNPCLFWWMCEVAHGSPQAVLARRPMPSIHPHVQTSKLPALLFKLELRFSLFSRLRFRCRDKSITAICIDALRLSLPDLSKS